MGREDQHARGRLLEQALIESRRGVSIVEFARRHGFDKRTVYRDLHALQDAGVPVACVDHRYRVVEGWRPARPAALTAEELVAVHAARRLARPLRNTRLGRALDRAWAKLAGDGAQPSLFPPAPADEDVNIRSHLTLDYGRFHRIVETFERAIAERRPVDARYQSLRSSEIVARTIEPGSLHFDPSLESLYLIGWCRLRRDIRIFAIHRFMAAAMTDETFRPRPELRSEVALRHAFRVWREAHVRRVRVLLRGRAAREARERRWHASQAVEDNGNHVVVTFDVAGLMEIESWVLAYGPDARVLEPPDLLEAVSRAASATAAQYERPRAPRRQQRRV